MKNGPIFPTPRDCNNLLEKVLKGLKTRGQKKAKIWVEDCDNQITTEYVEPCELQMIDGLFIWGFYGFDDTRGTSIKDDDSALDIPPVPNTDLKLEICTMPYLHDFKKNILYSNTYMECKKCGYSPELDEHKEEFKECHKSFLEWESRLKRT